MKPKVLQFLLCSDTGYSQVLQLLLCCDTGYSQLTSCNFLPTYNWGSAVARYCRNTEIAELPKCENNLVSTLMQDTKEQIHNNKYARVQNHTQTPDTTEHNIKEFSYNRGHDFLSRGHIFAGFPAQCQTLNRDKNAEYRFNDNSPA